MQISLLIFQIYTKTLSVVVTFWKTSGKNHDTGKDYETFSNIAGILFRNFIFLYNELNYRNKQFKKTQN